MAVADVVKSKVLLGGYMFFTCVRQLLRFSGGFVLPLPSRDNPVKVSPSSGAKCLQERRTNHKPTFIEQLQRGVDGFAKHIAYGK